MKSGKLNKTETGWWITYFDYNKKSDGTAHGKPIEVLLEVDPSQAAQIEALELTGESVEFQEILLQKDPESGWIEKSGSDKKREVLPTQTFARLVPRAKTESDFLETLREFAWEMWKAGAIAEDQRRESFDRFYLDFSESAKAD